MSCPVCGKVYCDHTPAERGQTTEEMLNDMMNNGQKSSGKIKEKSKQRKTGEEKKMKKASKKQKCHAEFQIAGTLKSILEAVLEIGKLAEKFNIATEDHFRYSEITNYIKDSLFPSALFTNREDVPQELFEQHEPTFHVNLIVWVKESQYQNLKKFLKWRLAGNNFLQTKSPNKGLPA